MSTRILTLLVAALLAGGVTTAVLKDGTTEPSGLSVPPTVPDEPFDPNATPAPTPTETMTFPGAPPFESPATVTATSTPTGGLPVTGGHAGWPPAFAALALAGVAGLALRRAGT